jgi:uncharacterized protein YabN with tetrapyrrole methylase and pyrophosphatase domain
MKIVKLGNITYNSVQAFCEKYDLSTYKVRKNIGKVSYERMIQNPYFKAKHEQKTEKKVKIVKHRPSVQDHLGNTFASNFSMARHYNINPYVLAKRMARGWNLERALTKKVNEHTKRN